MAFDRHATTMAVKSQEAFSLLAVRDGARTGGGQADAGLAYVPDGSALAVGRGTAIHFFDPSAKRRLLSVPDAHKGRVNALSFSSDSRWLYSAGRDGVVRLWHNDGTLQPGSVLPKAVTPRDTRGPVKSEADIVCTPDARKMACLTEANVIEVWQADLDQGTLTLAKALAPPQGAVTALALTPDGKSLITAGRDGAIRLFDLALGRERRLIGSHSLALEALALSSDGKQLASAGLDGAVRVWDVPETKRVAFRESVNALAFSPTADLLVSAGKDGTVRLWHALTGDAQGVLEERDGPIHALAFTPDGRELAVGHQDGTIALWDVAGRTSRGRLEVKGEVTSLAISADGKRLAAGTELGFLATFDLPRRQRLRQEVVHVERVSALALAPSEPSDGDFRWRQHRQTVTGTL